MSLSVDTHEVTELAADFSDGPNRTQRGAPKILERSARRVNDGMKRDARGHKFLSGLSRKVSRSRIGILEYEVGFDHYGQGVLANIATGGSINNAPVFDHTASLRRDEPILEAEMSDAAEGWALDGSEGRER